MKVYAAEPMPGEMLQGLRSLEEGFVPEVFDASVLDGRFLVTTAESIEALRRLTELEGIFAGVSSGGVLVVAARSRRADGVGHDRCPARRRRLEVPFRGRLVARPGRRISGGAEPVVSGEGRATLPSADEWAAIKRDPASVGASGAEAAQSRPQLLQEVIDALRAGVPNEACGILVSDRYWARAAPPLRWVACATRPSRRIAT